MQISTADEGKCHAMDVMLLMVGVVLGGGYKCSDTRRTPFPLLVADGLQRKEERGQTDCTGSLVPTLGWSYPQADLSGLN